MHLASRLLAATALCAAVGLLTACGGGGGSGATAAAPAPSAGSIPVPSTPPAPAPPAVPVVGASVQVTGIATFASVPNHPVTGALDYNAVSHKPVRGATLQAVSGSTVLATTSSSEQGTYAFTLQANTPFFVRMRAELVNTAGPANWSVAVKDNTAGNALWVVDGPTASSGAANSVRSVHAGSGWDGTAYSAARAAGPFAILDTVYTSMQLVRSVQPTAQFPFVTVYWSPNNSTANGELVKGEISTSFFQATAVGAEVSRSIYILGKANNDTDEYDNAVIAHEYGHYLQSAFSTNHSIGGGHNALQKLDMTLAFSEGWGNAWSSMARNSSVYTDSFGVQQGNGSAPYDLTQAPADNEVGWYREDSIDSSLYSLFVSQGFAPIWTALTGPMKNSQNAVATIFSFADALRSAGNAAATNALNTLLQAQNIFTGTGANQWGFGETLSGGDANNLPIYRSLSLGVPTQVCFSNANMTDSAANKLGAVRYFRMTLPTAGLRSITANFSAGRDVDFDVFQNAELLASALSPDPVSEVVYIQLAAGEAVVRVYDAVTSAPPATCATLTVN